MSIHVLTDATIFYDGLDLTSKSNKVDLTETAAEVDCTNFASNGWEEKLGGLKKVTAVGEGFVDYDADDPRFFANVGTTGKVFSAAKGSTAGVPAFTSRQLTGSYMHGGTIGEMEKFTLNMTGSNGPGLIPGVLLLPKTTVSGNSNGAGYELVGGIPAGYTGYVAIHCMAAGTTATVIVESDDADTFGSATTRFSNVITAVGSTWATPVAGAVTDTWFRVRTASVTGSFSLAVVFGIRPT